MVVAAALLSRIVTPSQSPLCVADDLNFVFLNPIFHLLIPLNEAAATTIVVRRRCRRRTEETFFTTWVSRSSTTLH